MCKRYCNIVEFCRGTVLMLQCAVVESAGKDFSIAIVLVFCMLLKHCIWLNKQRLFQCWRLAFVFSLVMWLRVITVCPGIVGTTRFCSSRDMFNSCQYVTYPNHNRIYRACIFTCDDDHCNSATVSTTSVIALTLSLLVAIVTVRLCWLAHVTSAFWTALCHVESTWMMQT